jgi:hypothetical protein
MSRQPKTIGGWAKKLYIMKGGKFEVYILGWTTPLKKTLRPMASMSAVPKSATSVSVTLVRKNGQGSTPFNISRDRLSKEFYT